MGFLDGLLDKLRGGRGMAPGGMGQTMPGGPGLLAGLGGGAPIMGGYSGGDAGADPGPGGPQAVMGGWSGGDAGVDPAMAQMPPGGPPGPPEAAQGRHGLGGLLDKMGTADGRGLTFGDKLFAAGSILRGDSGGAATYLQNQRAAADQLSERTRGRDLAKKGSAAFRSAMRPDGTVDFKALMDAMGDDFDPMSAMSMAKGMAPERSIITPGAAGAMEVTRPAFGGPSTTRELAPRTAPKPSIMNEDGTPNLEFIAARAREAEELARGRRTGAPLQPRAGRSGGKPKSYTRDEIQWGQ